MFSKVLSGQLATNKISLDTDVFSKLVVYYELTQKWAKKINITANLTPESYALENIIDPVLAHESLKSLGFFDNKAPFVFADFGCGGGFVGITWHILLGGRATLILVDSDRKKINFCREVCRQLKIQPIEIINNRCENLVETHADKLDFIVSRATFSDETLVLNSAAKLLSPGGKLLLLKGSGLATTAVSEDTGELKSAAPKLTSYTIMPSAAQRFVKIVDKDEADLTLI